MSNSFKIALAVVVLVVVAALVVANRRYSQLIRSLPPKVVCASKVEAFAATNFAGIGVLGTGSMQPYIRAADKGESPQSIVAYAITDSRPFSAISEGDLVLYWADWAHGLVMHQAIVKTKSGWIMGGLHNKQLETDSRMAEENFRGIVKAVYVW